MGTDTARIVLHELIDALPEEEVGAAERYLRFLGSGATDLVRWSLDTAPDEDEPISPAEDAGDEEAWREFRDRETVTAEEAKRHLLA